MCTSQRLSARAAVAAVEAFASKMERAHVFKFESLPISYDGEGSLDLPGIEAEEQEMFIEGLIPLPFDLCWFEATVLVREDGHRETFGFLVEKVSRGVEVRPIRGVHMPELVDIGGRLVRDYCDFTGEAWRIISIPGEDRLHIDASDPLGVASERAEMIGYSDTVRITGETGFVSWLILMLSSRSTHLETIDAPTKLNKSRVQKGKSAIPAYSVVSIIPKDIAKRMRSDGQTAGDGFRSSPRLHWRRSHRRTYANGRVAIIARMLIGYKSNTGEEILPTYYKVDLSG